MASLVAMAGSGEQIDNPVVGLNLRFVQTATDTGGELLEMEATYRPSSVEPVVHFHPSQREHFEILEGTMKARIGDGPARVLKVGETIDVDAGVVHSMWNPGPETARTRWETRPALRTEEFFETTFRLAREGKTNDKGVPGPLQVAVVASEFRDEFRTTSPPPAVQKVVLAVLAPIGRLLGRRA
jgi:mannose-6-phosphate isomerase-like protein (cupin superfamily)